MSKSTDAEIELRLNTIYDLVVKGLVRKDIVRYCAENFNIESRQVDTYLQRVYNEIKESYGTEYKDNLISKQLARFDHLYVKNYNNKDYRECRNVLETINKLLGLNEPNKNINLNLEQKELTDEEITRIKNNILNVY